METTKLNKIIPAFIAVVLLLAVFVVAKSVIIPAVLSVFISFLLMPVIRWLTKKKVPLVPASLLSLAIIIAVLFLLAFLLIVSLKSLNRELPFYTERMREIIATVLFMVKSHGLEINGADILNELDPSQIAGFVGKGMLSFVGVISNLVLIFFITLFILMESQRFKEKSEKAFSKESPILKSTHQIGEQMQRYIIWKTVISLGTGICVWIFLAIVGVDFALLWGLLTFLLNFIPSVGSIFASVPPVLIALLQFESPILYAVITLIGLIAIQMVIGNYIDPKILGRELNLSPLIVFLNMVLWGFLWGVIGMLISTPLLVCVKVIISHNKDLKPIAIMLEE